MTYDRGSVVAKNCAPWKNQQDKRKAVKSPK
jgi:hypothetical protein